MTLLLLSIHQASAGNDTTGCCARIISVLGVWRRPAEASMFRECVLGEMRRASIVDPGPCDPSLEVSLSPGFCAQ